MGGFTRPAKLGDQGLTVLHLGRRASTSAARALYRRRLVSQTPGLQIVDNLGTLEELRIDDNDAILDEFSVMKDFPNLASELVELTVDDHDVLDWMDVYLPSLRRVKLYDFEHDFSNWEDHDAFVGLKNLYVYMLNTASLVNFPLRVLKELSLENHDLNLDPTDFEEVRTRIKRPGLKVILDPATLDPVISKEQESAIDVELKFWATVEPRPTCDWFYYLKSGIGAAFDSDNDEDSE